MKRLIATGLMGPLFLMGCSTVHVSAYAARPVTYDLVYDRTLTSESANGGHVVVVRDSGDLGYACNFDVFLDTTRVATLKYPSTEIDMYPQPGSHVLSVSNTTAMCPNHRAAVNLDVKAGGKYIYDLSMFSEGTMDLVPAAD